MDLITKLKVWAAGGTQLVVPDAKIDTGWLEGEQPAFEYENERMFTRDTKLNGLIDVSNKKTANKNALFSNISNGNINQVGFPFSAGNTIEGTGQILDTCYAENSESGYLYWLQLDTATTGSVHYKNLITGVTSSFSLGAGIVGLTIASDGEYVYILGRAELDATNWGYTVYAYNAGTGDAKTGFTSIMVGGILKTAEDLRPTVKVLNSGAIFIAGKWLGFGFGTIATLNQDTGAPILSNTDAGDGTTKWPSGSIATLGDSDVLVASIDGAGGRWVYKFSETGLVLDPLYPYVFSVATDVGDSTSLVSLGDYFAMSYNSSTASIDGAYIFIRNAQNETLKDIYVGSTDPSVASKVGSMFFDGHYLWVVVHLALTELNYVVRLNLASFELGTPGVINLSDILNPTDQFQYNLEAGLPDIKSGRPRMSFDGQSVWFGLWEDAPTSESNKLRRVLDSFIR